MSDNIANPKSRTLNPNAPVRRARTACALASVALWAVIGLTATGCSSLAGSAPGPLSPRRLLPGAMGAKIDEENLRRKVESDSFPTAAEAGLKAIGS